MSHLPYMCHFRTIIHVWQEDPDGEGRTMWHPFAYESFDLVTWTDTFEFRCIKQYEKDKKDLSKYLDHPSNIQLVEGSDSYLNDKTLSSCDYGKEMIESGDIISRIIEDDIKPEGEKYFEIIGKFHFHSYQNYEGEWDGDDDVSELQFQEIAEEDVNNWAKKQGLTSRDN